MVIRPSRLWDHLKYKFLSHLKSGLLDYREPNDLNHSESTIFDHLRSFSSSLRSTCLQTSNAIFVDILNLREGVKICSINYLI
jgi:hypothetical protein